MQVARSDLHGPTISHLADGNYIAPSARIIAEIAPPPALRPDIGEVYIAARVQAQSGNASCAAGQSDDLAGKAGFPFLPAPAMGHPFRSLRFGIGTRAVPDGIEHDIRQIFVIGAGRAAESMESAHAEPAIRRGTVLQSK